MKEAATKRLLRNRKVIDEINRHLWIESEKVGYDIGFDKAADDWLKRFSRIWMQYHMPPRKIPSQRMMKSSARLKKTTKKRTRSKSLTR